MTSNNSIINHEVSSEFKIKLKEPETTTSMGKKTTTSNMSGNKHMNKLAAEIVKKQDRISDRDQIIAFTKKTLQILIGRQEKEEKEIADIKKQQQDIKNHKTGQLAKVSLYEFVNDWLRPETSFKIFSYLSDPHKEGINKVRTHRRYFRKARWGNNHPKWEERRFYLYSDHNEHIPYCNLPLYKEISSPFFKQNPADERAHYEKMSDWARRYEGNYRSGYSITLEKLRNTNPILYELWKFHRTYETLNKGDKKFIITKGDIKKYLTLNKVNNRSLLTKGTKCSEKDGVDETYDYIWGPIWFPPQARRELVEALMKI